MAMKLNGSGAPPIALLVLGMHRSGTSAVTRTLNLMGAALPANLLEPSTTENPEGFWESGDIVESHDRFLAAIGSCWDDPLPLAPPVFTTPAAAACHDALVAILRRDVAQMPLFAVKDPRLCRLVPLWRSVLATVGARPMAILPVREPGAVAMSLHRRNGFSREKSMMLWLVHSLLAESATRDWPRAFVRYDAFVRSPAEATLALAARLECFPAATVRAALPAIEQFWCRELRHHAATGEGDAPAFVRNTWFWLARAAMAEEPEPGDLDAIGRALASSLEVVAPLVAGVSGLEAALRIGNEDLAECRRSSAEASAECTRLTQGHGALEAELAECRHRAGLLEQAKAEASAECARLTQRSGALETELAEWRDKAAHLAQTNAEISAECARLTQRSGALEAELAEWRDRTARLERAAEIALAERVRLQESNATAIQDGVRLAADNAVLRTALAAEQAVTADLQAGTASLHRQLDALRDVEHALRDVRQALRPRSLLARLPRGLRRWAEAAAILPYLRGGMFDAVHYRAHHHGWLSPRLHYALTGRLQGASPNRLFDPSYYLACNHDVRATGTDPFLHYARHGGREGRKPSPCFDGAFYLAQYPDVARKRANPLRHYLNHGWREGRDPNPLFDASYYAEQYGIRSEPLSHYLEHGARAGLKPGPLLDGARYLEENPDVAEAGLNPLVHYLEFGQAEGRKRPAGDPIAESRGGPCILMVQHGLGGGVERHCRDMEALLEAEGVRVWRLESLSDDSYRLANRASGTERAYSGGAEEAALLADLRRIRPDLIHVHHVIGYGARLSRWLADLGRPYVVTIHDYALLCPRVTLLDGSHRYCGAPDALATCDRCVASAGAHPSLQSAVDAVGGAQAWHDWSTLLLAGARGVYVPHQDVADRLRRWFPRIVPSVRPHPEPLGVVPARPPAGGGRVRIGVIGSIGPHKGFDILLACARAARRDGLKLTFVVIGEVCMPDKVVGLDTIEVTGRYHQPDLPRVIDQARCHAAAFLSVWPETHMYTLTEALRAGLYPVVFDLGAPARRLRDLGWGSVLPLDLKPEEINRRLMELALDHPPPTSDLTIGYRYDTFMDSYYR